MEFVSGKVPVKDVTKDTWAPITMDLLANQAEIFAKTYAPLGYWIVKTTAVHACRLEDRDKVVAWYNSGNPNGATGRPARDFKIVSEHQSTYKTVFKNQHKFTMQDVEDFPVVLLEVEYRLLDSLQTLLTEDGIVSFGQAYKVEDLGVMGTLAAPPCTGACCRVEE
jgi:hypothetical protein